jgi:2-polyprenyl-3-methyl-5-hydroxy-6-metoxy-1,4-benzoquinol methylase
MDTPEKEIHPYNTSTGWDDRYSKHGADGAGTFVHTLQGNMLFYRSKCKAIDRCVRISNNSLENSFILDAAGGTGKFIEYFLSKNCKKLMVSDFSVVAVKSINEKYTDNRLNTSVFDLTSKASPWEGVFDFVFVMEAIFLLKTDSDLAKAMENLSRALKPGGVMIFSDLFPEEEIKIGNYVTYRPLSLYNHLFQKNKLTSLGFVPQTFIFNRNSFGRFQSIIEKTSSFLYYLDQLILSLGITRKRNNIKYAVLKKEE